jgi:hypothetical protein
VDTRCGKATRDFINVFPGIKKCSSLNRTVLITLAYFVKVSLIHMSECHREIVSPCQRIFPNL